LLELQASAGNAAVAQLFGAPRVGRTRRATRATVDADPSGIAGDVTWIGQIDAPWSAALRSGATKDPDDPHANAVADLPQGTYVHVIGKSGGWRHVEVSVNGSPLDGYVSHELIRYVRPSSFEFEPLVITGRAMTLADAFLTLKRAETELAADAKYAASEDEGYALERAILTLEQTGRYAVDRATYRVSFVPGAAGTKITIDSIEDFILFVETVERQYPTASPRQVASEIRELWFSESPWPLLIGSEGISTDGRLENIETGPNPIARMFEMADLAPDVKKPETHPKQISTRLGQVDISHVLAGIDAALSRSPASFPATTLPKVTSLRELTRFAKAKAANELIYTYLKVANEGDPRDFATWSGDIGQAYAAYLVARYVAGDAAATLAPFVNEEAPSGQLQADIHGYIAVQVWNDTPVGVDAGGKNMSVSNILRAFYLVDKAGTAAGTSYRNFFLRITGKSDLRAYVVGRSIAFARLAFVQFAIEQRGLVSSWWKSEGFFTLKPTLDAASAEFDRLHAKNEQLSGTENKLEGLIDAFMRRLKEEVR
jgi:hypothetical protein